MDVLLGIHALESGKVEPTWIGPMTHENLWNLPDYSIHSIQLAQTVAAHLAGYVSHLGLAAAAGHLD